MDISPWSMLANRGFLKQLYSRDPLVSPNILFGFLFFADDTSWYFWQSADWLVLGL